MGRAHRVAALRSPGAVRALARLGGSRALPSLRAALYSDVDIWRAIQVTGHLPHAAKDLVPRLCDHLDRSDLTKQRNEMSITALLAALAALRDPAAAPAVVDTPSVQRTQQGVSWAALNALKAFVPRQPVHVG